MKTEGRGKALIIGLFVVAAIILGKLFYIQIIDDEYKINSNNNSMVYDIIYPTRGIIYDRNGKIIVSNKVTYDILVTPREVKQFDTLMLADALNVTPEFIRDKMNEYARNRRRIGYQSVVMLKQIKPETYMQFAEIQYKFPGFRGQARSIRDYPVNAGGNLLGYVSEVDANYIEKHSGEYRPGDYAGKTGIEAARRNCVERKGTTSTFATPATRSSSATKTERWTRKPYRDTTSTPRSTRICSNTAKS